MSLLLEKLDLYCQDICHLNQGIKNNVINEVQEDSIFLKKVVSGLYCRLGTLEVR